MTATFLLLLVILGTFALTGLVILRNTQTERGRVVGAALILLCLSIPLGLAIGFWWMLGAAAVVGAVLRMWARSTGWKIAGTALLVVILAYTAFLIVYFALTMAFLLIDGQGEGN